MRYPWVVCLALLVSGCTRSADDDCKQRDYSICGTPLGELDDSGEPWPSYTQDLAGICGDPTFIDTSLGYCDDGKRVLARSWDFGSDQRFYAGETLVGRMAAGDVFGIDVGSPTCICSGRSFQGTLDSVHCVVTSAEALCGRAGPPWIDQATLRFRPVIVAPECECAAEVAAAAQ